MKNVRWLKFLLLLINVLMSWFLYLLLMWCVFCSWCVCVCVCVCSILKDFNACQCQGCNCHQEPRSSQSSDSLHIYDWSVSYAPDPQNVRWWGIHSFTHSFSLFWSYVFCMHGKWPIRLVQMCSYTSWAHSEELFPSAYESHLIFFLIRFMQSTWFDLLMGLQIIMIDS